MHWLTERRSRITCRSSWLAPPVAKERAQPKTTRQSHNISTPTRRPNKPSPPSMAQSSAGANWVAAEIHVPGDSVEIIDQNFSDSTKRRSMKLHPQDDVVEIAVLNLPPFEAPAPDAVAPTPAPGQYFQIYYDLVKSPPARADRLGPFATSAAGATDPQGDWGTLHPRQLLWSNLVEQR